MQAFWFAESGNTLPDNMYDIVRVDKGTS